MAESKIPAISKITEATFTGSYAHINNLSFTVIIAGRICMLKIAIGDGSAFSTATGADTIGIIPAACRPSSVRYGVGLARDNGVWSSANYTPVMILINANGNVDIRGNETAIKSCKYITAEVQWPIY